MTEGIENVTRVSPAKGNYAIQFPEGTDEKMKQEWADVYAQAKKEGKPIILEPGVKVIDLDAVSRVEIAQKPVEAPVVAPVAPAVVEAPAPTVAPPVQPQVPLQPQYAPGYIPADQVQFYQPQYQPTQGQPMQYNPFYAQNANPGMQQVVQQQVPPQQVVYYPGVAPQYGYVQVPQQQVAPQQRVVYNPQLAEGPIGQHSATVPQAAPQERVGGPNATLQHPVYTVQGQPPQQ